MNVNEHLSRGASKFELYESSNLTRNQLQVWIGQNLLPEVPIYNLAVALNINGEIDSIHFQNAFSVLVRSSDALRTVVEDTDGIPMQRVVTDGQSVMDCLDFSQLPNPGARVRNWMVERCQTPLSWKGPLFDSVLIKVSAKRFVWYLNVHHIICDGWSFELIYRYMADLYERFLQKQMPKTIDLPLFGHYLRYERTYRNSSRHEKAEAYWKQKLAECGDRIDFYGRAPVTATTRVRRISQDLGAERTERLKSMAEGLGRGMEPMALFDIFASVLVAYLYCVDGKDNYTIGVPFHNRRSKGLSKETIGLFSEVLPVSVSIADDETFASLIRKFNQETLRTLRHGQYSVANPYFKRIYEVALNYHTRSFSDFAGVPVSPEWVHNGHGDDSLTVQVRDFGSSNRLAVDFDLHESLFSEQDSQQVVSHFLCVLDASLADPGRSLRRLSLASPEESRRMIVEWNTTRLQETANGFVHQMFEEQARRRPSDLAVVFQDEELTYSELNNRANQVARLLLMRGIRPGMPVALYVERTPDMIIGLLGILKAGGAFVPIDPQYSSDWLWFILKDTQAPVLLTQRELLNRLPQDRPEVICLDVPCETRDQECDENIALDLQGEHLAYIIYTSGSSGNPKGVEITHAAMSNFTNQVAEIFELRPSDRVLQFTSISFDTSVEEIFPCLLRGATLVLRTDSMLESVSTFLESCRAWNITVLDLPTSYWHEFAARLFADSLTMPDHIRLVIIGGERAIPERLTLWQACGFQKVRLLNTYGPTETTVAVTVCDLTDAQEETISLSEVSIGRPIPNIQTYVLDENLNPVPAGMRGELYIGGVGLARGYLNQPGLTAEKFIPNPFADNPGARLYRSGDIVRQRPDGKLEFLRRLDRQVKMQGFRIELEGIEAALTSHPLIHEAVVVQESASSQKQIVAYMVPKPAAVLNPEDIRAHIRRRLPEFMLPAVFVALDSLPLNGAGKVDRRALSASLGNEGDRGKVLDAPRTPTEEQIAAIWREVLQMRAVGREEHFFGLGGHSLLAVQVVSRIRKQLQAEIPLRVIFEAPTVAQLAERVDEALQKAAQKLAEENPVAAASRTAPLPVSSSQARIWFMHQFAPESAAYNIAVPIRFTGVLQKSALRQSLQELTRRHEVLRTVFQNQGGKPVQIIAPVLSLEMPETDLRPIPQELRLVQAKQILKKEASRSFDLEQGPLVRALLLQLDEEDHVLLLNMHHLIVDQWSMGVLAREVTTLYNSFGEALPLSNAPLSLQYADFAVWEGERLSGERWETQLGYWKRQLAGIQPLLLPTDYSRPRIQTFHGAHQQLLLSRNLVEKLKVLGVRENVTLYMVFLAAFQTLLLRYSGQEDIVVGSPITNRTRVEWERVIGTFINILVLRSNLSGNPTFRELLRRVRGVVLDAFAHQEMPFEKLIEELQWKRDPSRAPLIQVLFNFHNQPAGQLDLLGLSWAPFEIDQWASQFDISVTVDPDLTRRIIVSFNTDLYDGATIARLLRHYERLLESIAADADQSITTLPMLTEAERDQVLVQWTDTQAPYPECCVHDLFESQVRRTPDSIAVLFDDRGVTYQELNERANNVAYRLQSLGLKPEVPVGICMERSPDLLVGLLGILKAGGAYVPIDPDLPPERIAFMVEDSSMPVLLTQERLLGRIPKSGCQVVCIEPMAVPDQAEASTNPEQKFHPRTLAYIIYTSGSTGEPKAVAVEHKALVNFLHSMRRKPGIAEDDILLSVTTPSFDIAALELFLPLIVGACVVLVAREIASDGRRLRKEMERSRATMMQATPATWRMLLDADWQGAANFKILCGGEAMALDLAAALLARSASVWNLYGPTETTVWSLIWRVVDLDPGRVPIGRPIANTLPYVLDSNLEPVPVGVVGELYLGGDSVARGYLKRPALTAAKFISAPYGHNPGARLFKTGDRARYLPDGNLEWLGRIDQQVKIRGYRIEVEEVESVLSEHPAVRQAAVAAKEIPEEKQKRLVAYVVLRGNFVTPEPRDLANFLRKKLPEYMLPSLFMFLDTLPLTTSGKVNRQALPQPSLTTSSQKRIFLAPRDPIELQLTKLWEKVLNVSPIGLWDNFFDLGGHSLLAVKLLGEIEKDSGKHLPLATLFTAPTVEQLAEVLRQEGCISK